RSKTGMVNSGFWVLAGKAMKEIYSENVLIFIIGLGVRDCWCKGRIDEIDAGEDIALVSTHDYVVQDEGIEDVVATAIADVSAAKTIVTAAPTITAESIKTNVEVTQAPKRKGVMIQEP
nr:hypothetical protein [Tanacetum cinerariifolium]